MTDDGMSFVQRLNALMRELGEMKDRAGGWVSMIPADEKAAWLDRKRALLVECEAQRSAVTA